METKDVFGARIRAARLRKRMSLRALARAAGLKASSLHEIERGEVTARPTTKEAILRALGLGPADVVSPDELEHIEAWRALRPEAVPHLKGLIGLLAAEVRAEARRAAEDVPDFVSGGMAPDDEER